DSEDYNKKYVDSWLQQVVATSACRSSPRKTGAVQALIHRDEKKNVTSATAMDTDETGSQDLLASVTIIRPESGDEQGEQQRAAEKNEEEESPDVIYGTPNSSAFPVSTSINESLISSEDPDSWNVPGPSGIQTKKQPPSKQPHNIPCVVEVIQERIIPRNSEKTKGMDQKTLQSGVCVEVTQLDTNNAGTEVESRYASSASRDAPGTSGIQTNEEQHLSNGLGEEGAKQKVIAENLQKASDMNQETQTRRPCEASRNDSDNSSSGVSLLFPTSPPQPSHRSSTVEEIHSPRNEPSPTDSESLTEFKHKPKPRPPPSLMFKHVEARRRDAVASVHPQEKQAGPRCSQKDPKNLVGNTEPQGHQRIKSDHHQVVLRDGRTLLGYLRSVDQFANLVLHRTVERIYVGKKYGDMDRGVFIVRGENVCLLGEIVSSKFVVDLHKANLNNAAVDEEKEAHNPLEKVSFSEILEEQRHEQEAKQEKERLRMKFFSERGLVALMMELCTNAFVLSFGSSVMYRKKIMPER
ncbi:unnamed protein product, partial [Darwinula stevensoni]